MGNETITPPMIAKAREVAERLEVLSRRVARSWESFTGHNRVSKTENTDVSEAATLLRKLAAQVEELQAASVAGQVLKANGIDTYRPMNETLIMFKRRAEAAEQRVKSLEGALDLDKLKDIIFRHTGCSSVVALDAAVAILDAATLSKSGEEGSMEVVRG